MGTLAFLAGFGLLGGSAALIAACLRLNSARDYLLATYLAAWTEVVVLCAALSLSRAVTRTGLLVGLGALALWAWIVWQRCGGAPAPISRAHVRRLLDDLRDPILGVLALGVGIGYVYVAALAVLTPQNEGDPLVYELTRAALWRQEHAIGLVGVDFEPRLDANPIVAEVGQLAAMVLAGSARYVAVGQLAAVAALSVGAYSLGRRIGLTSQGALFGALIAPTLPVVALQSWTGGNDIVLASFVVVAAVFVSGRGPAELVLAGLATALAVGTKFTGPVALPVLLLVAVTAQSAGRRARAVGAVLGGAVVGGGWYVANVVRTGDLDGGLEERSAQGAAGGLGNAADTASRLVLDAIDASGSIDGYVWGYAAAGAVLAVALLRARAPRVAFLGPLLVAGAPYIVHAVGRATAEVLALGWEIAGNPDTAEQLRDWDVSTVANAYISWFGPLVVVLVAVVALLAGRGWRRRSLPGLALTLALAPVVSLVVMSASIAYDPSRGRFFVGSVVLACALWGLLMPIRWLSATITATCVVTLALVLVNAMAKPSGIQAGQYSFSPAVWRLDRWESQTLLRPTPPERDEASAIRFVEEHVPEDATIGLELRANDFLFPYFGPSLRRRVELLDTPDPAPAEADWLVAAPGRAPLACQEAWRIAHGRGGWRVWRRVGDDDCERWDALRPSTIATSSVPPGSG